MKFIFLENGHFTLVLCKSEKKKIIFPWKWVTYFEFSVKSYQLHKNPFFTKLSKICALIFREKELLLSYSILYEKYLIILMPKAAKRLIFREIKSILISTHNSIILWSTMASYDEKTRDFDISSVIFRQIDEVFLWTGCIVFWHQFFP